MRIIKENQIAPFIARLRRRASTSVREDEIQRTVRKIIADVQKEGDRAVFRYTEKFDAIRLKSLTVDSREINDAAKKAGKDFLRALKRSAKRIRQFHERQREASWKYSEEGITLGQIISPLQRVGVYVPGGKAAYPSTVLMNVIPAQVAGVPEIALCVPTPGGRLNPHVAAAVKLLRVNEVYRIGGAQAVAALAYGTKTIRQVDKIVGPGNIYVAVAKRMVFGEVGIDMVAGPSEILVIADRSGDPAFIAADLLSQAEHDEMVSSVLVTDSAALARAVSRSLRDQMKKLTRKNIAQNSLARYGAIIITGDLDEAVRVANMIAPEHLEIMTAAPKRLLPGIRNAGAVFLGKWTPEPLGDYAAGPNHTLPTGGTARFSSPLGVYDFIKRTSLLNASMRGFMGLADTVETFADLEGLEAHGNTVRVRLKKSGRTEARK
ncbi:MAG: histidinol dehydrogenase [Nitrospiraceae bacterium]|nr:MAG: histidinol dehydrogenase [Nitrospiraceae bacterium]